MPPRRGRSRKGDRRIDAAIDHFAAMGYAARDVRSVVNGLLKEYGVGADAWPLLEEGSYYVVQELLFKKEEEEQKLLLEHHPQGGEQQGEVGQEPPQELLLKKQDGEELLKKQEEEKQQLLLKNRPQEEGQQGEVGQELPQHEGLEGNTMAMLEVHQDASAELESPNEWMEMENPVISEQPTLVAVVPLPIATRTGGTVRRPCYGWISESDDDEEEEPSS